MANDEWLQWILVGGPILSLVATWMSLRTYGRLKQKSIEKSNKYVKQDSGEP